MEQPITIQPAASLRGFCQHVVATYTGKWPPSEEFIAAEFVTFFKLGPLVAFSGLADLCSSLGINVSVTRLPVTLRGHNFAYQETRRIIIAEKTGKASVFGSREHTLLHELRELIEYEFAKMQSPTAASFKDKEERAEDFAAEVRVLSAYKFFDKTLHTFGNPKWTFGDVCFAVLFGIVMLLYGTACITLPQWEDKLSS